VRAALAIAAVALVVVLPAAGSTPGARILFNETHGPGYDIVETDADATNYLNLTPGDQTSYASDQDGSWSPDGSRIVFSSHRDSNVSTEIYVMDADGSNQRRLTTDGPNGVQNSSPEIFDLDPVSSPLGGAIAYVKSVHSAKDIWLMRPDGSDQHRLTSDGGEKSLLQWTPAGSRILFSTRDGTYAVSVVGGTPVKVVTAPAAVLSPDGTRFAYGNDQGLWTADANGQNPTRLTDVPAGDPAWSPDGSTLAFVGTRAFPELASPKFGTPRRQDVYTVRVDGSDLHRLTGPLGDEFEYVPTGFAPTWWPDGSRLFFTSQRPPTERATTYVMNADGSCEGTFSNVVEPLLSPLWRPGSNPGLGPIRCVDLRLLFDTSGGGVGPAALGQPITFPFSVDNDGNETATGVKVELSAPLPTAEILGGNGGAIPCAGSAQDLVCTLAALPPRTPREVAFQVRSTVAGWVQLTATVSADEADSDPSSNTVPIGARVLPCTRVGTWGDDVIVGTPGPDKICALPGADRVYGGAGNDYLDAGNGADVVVGGPGRDVILGKGGNDTIYARDGQKDWIDCGTERDVAIVDRLDVVRHCETVVRPRR
jgi:Tol biopolymer transport system component